MIVLYMPLCHTSIKNGVLMTRENIYNIVSEKKSLIKILCVHYDSNFV